MRIRRRAGVVLRSDDAHAAAVATRLAKTLEDPFELDMVSVQIGASIGVASRRRRRRRGRADALRRQGDEPLQAGRHRERDERRADRRRARPAADDGRTAYAIAENQFELHYQPEVNVRNGTYRRSKRAPVAAPAPRLHPAAGVPAAGRGGGLVAPLTTLVMDRR